MVRRYVNTKSLVHVRRDRPGSQTVAARAARKTPLGTATIATSTLSAASQVSPRGPWETGAPTVRGSAAPLRRPAWTGTARAGTDRSSNPRPLAAAASGG